LARQSGTAILHRISPPGISIIPTQSARPALQRGLTQHEFHPGHPLNYRSGPATR